MKSRMLSGLRGYFLKIFFKPHRKFLFKRVTNEIAAIKAAILSSVFIIK